MSRVIHIFLKNTLREDFQEICKAMEIPKGERDRKIDEIARRLDIASLLSLQERTGSFYFFQVHHSLQYILSLL